MDFFEWLPIWRRLFMSHLLNCMGVCSPIDICLVMSGYTLPINLKIKIKILHVVLFLVVSLLCNILFSTGKHQQKDL